MVVVNLLDDVVGSTFGSVAQAALALAVHTQQAYPCDGKYQSKRDYAAARFRDGLAGQVDWTVRRP